MNPPSWHLKMPSPVGLLLITATGQGLRGLWMSGEKHCPLFSTSLPVDPAPSGMALAPDPGGSGAEKARHILHETVRQLEEYFAGTRQEFDLPLDLPGGSGFQRQAWEALLAIPFGQTRSYREQAAAIGKPSAVRAIGTANGSNPVSIVVPCHRVIGANGSLTGYGGGLPAKRWLLDHERAIAGTTTPALL